MVRMRRSPADHGYEGRRGGTGRHVHRRDLDGLAGRRGRGRRDGTTVLGGGEGEDEGDGGLGVGFEVELATPALPALLVL